MKKVSIINKLCLVSVFVAVGFTGCINSNMIKITKTEDGSIKYRMFNKIKPNIQNFEKYNDWNVHDYDMDINAIDDKVTIKLKHEISFTVGSGNPHEKYVKRYLYHGINDFKIIGLKSQGDVISSNYKNILFDAWYETLSHIYAKKDFIDFVLKNDSIKMTINSSKFSIKSKDSQKEMNILGINNLKKFALCLENNSTCIEKKSSK